MKFHTIKWVDGEVEILDQTLLPTRESYIQLKTYGEIIEAIKHLRVRGAPLIGIAAAYAVTLAARHSTNKIDFALAVNEIKTCRSTAVNLSWAVERMLITYHACADSPDRDERLLELARQIHNEDARMCEAIGTNGMELLPESASILTHCNAGALATGGCGTALGIVYQAVRAGKKLAVFADETRPILQGARLTAWELAREGIEVTVIADNAAGSLMSQKIIDCCIVGADRIAANYDVANKIGTYPLAILAKQHQIPFYVAAPTTTFDNQAASGMDIHIEQRSPNEIAYFGSHKIVPDQVKILNPAFDITPSELINAIITENEIIKCARFAENG